MGMRGGRRRRKDVEQRKAANEEGLAVGVRTFVQICARRVFSGQDGRAVEHGDARVSATEEVVRGANPKAACTLRPGRSA
jgi:hypothetical protein